MKLADFKKQPRGPYQFDWFLHRDTIDSPLGTFAVELTVAMGKQPDQAMVDAMEILIGKFEKNKSAIAQMVFKEYLTIARSEPDWLAGCEVPPNLLVDGLAPYLEARALTVSDDRALTVSDEVDNADDRYHPRVYMSPSWDEEHGFYLKFDGDQIERVDC
ncbi:MAG TPA: hypothetical protein VGH19_04130 [Verrucomicrobiae bacterium]